MGHLDPLIEQQFREAAQRIQQQEAAEMATMDGDPTNVRLELERDLSYFFGTNKRNAHPQAGVLFPACNRVESDYLNEDFFQFYPDLSSLRPDGSAIGSENAIKGGYKQVISVPYNPHPIQGGMKAYERVGFLYQGTRLLAYTHFFDLGDGVGPISRDDQDTLDKGAVFLDDKIIVLVPREGSAPQAGVFANGEELQEFLTTHLYDELDELTRKPHKETTPANPDYASRNEKLAQSAKTIGKLPVVFAFSVFGRNDKANSFGRGRK